MKRELVLGILAALLIPCLCWGAPTSKAITDYPSETTPASNDIIHIIKSPGGADTDRQATIGNLTKGLTIANFPASASVVSLLGAADYAAFASLLSLGTSAYLNAGTRIEGKFCTWSDTYGYICTSDGGGMSNPMDGVGQIIYGGGSGSPTKLAACTDGYLLSWGSGIPTCVNSLPGLTITGDTASVAACFDGSKALVGCSNLTDVVPTRTIASGSKALATSEIASAACSAAQDGGTATGVATTDIINWTFNADPTSTTGYTPSANGMLTIISYPTTDHVNFKVCNNTSGAITPGAITLNWKVQR